MTSTPLRRCSGEVQPRGAEAAALNTVATTAPVSSTAAMTARALFASAWVRMPLTTSSEAVSETGSSTTRLASIT